VVEELAGGGVWVVTVSGGVWKRAWGIRAAGSIRHDLGVMGVSDDGNGISVRTVELGGGEGDIFGQKLKSSFGWERTNWGNLDSDFCPS
jgi:hypothetical protein